ncbi:S8 family serine peptidase [Streptomyces sp. NBC_00047]|uniref:S8 family serine peptidase n=2 Tax=unclassified Streptomyces TaxID=2593676 RepID=UPI0022512EFA|nr:S8 family serine peptidase [Streptomyces sp. NBC_00047]MCX5606469.1 S8 family serine peptidase [Streptomyces sp. NBC_00047]
MDLVGLTSLMKLTSGEREIAIGLLDGPVAMDHPALTAESIRQLPGGGPCFLPGSSACRHGTFIAGILVARRGGAAPAICPGCTVIARPVFAETTSDGQRLPSVTAPRLAEAICACVDAGAQVLNLSAGMSQPSTRQERELHMALNYAAGHGALVVVAAGNQGTLGSSALTRHPWVIPVVGYGMDAQPMAQSNLGSSMGKRGLGAPGENVTSLSPNGGLQTQDGTSVAAAFVTGAIALLWSRFPKASVSEIKRAVTGGHGPRRTSVVPPLLDAWGAHQTLSVTQSARVTQ